MTSRPLILFDIDETLLCPVRVQEAGSSIIKQLIQCDADRRGGEMAVSLQSFRVQSQPFAVGLYVVDTGSLSQSSSLQVQFKELDTESFIDDMEYVVFLRPYMVQMIANIHIQQQFDIGVFSVGSKLYVDAILRLIEKYVALYLGNSSGNNSLGPLFKIRKYKHDAKEDHEIGDFIKDLSVVEGYSMQRIILIDNKSINFSRNQQNGVPIRPFNLFSMEQREFDKKPYKFDLQLHRLQIYLSQLNPERSLTQQNVFRYVDQ